MASFIGTAIEFYDFFLYGAGAALIFNLLFFPVIDPLIGTVAAFVTFGVGFLARRLGWLAFATPPHLCSAPRRGSLDPDLERIVEPSMLKSSAAYSVYDG